MRFVGTWPGVNNVCIYCIYILCVCVCTKLVEIITAFYLDCCETSTANQANGVCSYWFGCDLMLGIQLDPFTGHSEDNCTIIKFNFTNKNTVRAAWPDKRVPLLACRMLNCFPCHLKNDAISFGPLKHIIQLSKYLQSNNITKRLFTTHDA